LIILCDSELGRNGELEALSPGPQGNIPHCAAVKFEPVVGVLALKFELLVACGIDKCVRLPVPGGNGDCASIVIGNTNRSGTNAARRKNFVLAI
jgi:hypothetical protein